ncbi:hypothetical protein RJ641_026288 [Dillenia turbinata]|uniref:Uncharacterized protein n=1 Tax=Dillenia turbinata TaxID=194707 RepID=A0AAN8WAT0_9MAGN
MASPSATDVENTILLLMRCRQFQVMAQNPISALWDFFCFNVSGTSELQSRGALSILCKAAKSCAGILGSLVRDIIDIGFGRWAKVDPSLAKTACIALQRLSEEKGKLLVNNGSRLILSHVLRRSTSRERRKRDTERQSLQSNGYTTVDNSMLGLAASEDAILDTLSERSGREIVSGGTDAKNLIGFCAPFVSKLCGNISLMQSILSYKPLACLHYADL